MSFSLSFIRRVRRCGDGCLALAEQTVFQPHRRQGSDDGDPADQKIDRYVLVMLFEKRDQSFDPGSGADGPGRRRRKRDRWRGRTLLAKRLFGCRINNS